MTIEQAKQMDMVDYLSRQGFQPAKISGHSYWYHSPLHDEKTPSFKVNRKMNRWFDFADGKGGNLVDFGILLHQCSVSVFLQKLDGPVITLNQSKPIVHQPQQDNRDNAISILSVHSISSYPLQKYLHSRRINMEIADKYLKEVRYQIGDKTYYALGFKNDAGGYELRNASFKGSSSPKDSTFIDNGAKDIAVFEGFFNFLSYKNMYHNQQEPLRNYLVLNSTSFFEKSLTKMQEHQRVHLFLDNDKTGQRYTEQAVAFNKEKFQDERRLYQGYDDLNHWLVHIGQSQKQQLKLKP
ncbi:MAG: toprim domain-containing protein [Agriterribacter sp.]